MEKIQKQKLKLMSYDIKNMDIRTLSIVFVCIMYLYGFILFIFGGFLPDPKLLPLIVAISLILILAIALGFFYYPKFAKKPIPAAIEYNLVDKQFIIHYGNAKMFPPKTIRFDEVSEITCTYTGARKNFITVALNFITADNRNFSLRSFDSSIRHITFIATLETFKERENFKIELKNFPKSFLSWFDKYKHEGKHDFFHEYDGVLVFICIILIVVGLFSIGSNFLF